MPSFCRKFRSSYLLLFIVALASRWWVLGNPFIFFDEEFYLFTGGRMLHGALPYVDIWDRKPVGIFLIYELFHLLGPYRIWAYQIGALLSAWGTSVLCMKISRYIAPPTGSFIAGCLYLLWTAGAQGCGGQTPIFYNLLITSSIFILIKYLNSKPSQSILKVGISIMILFGVSLQIKPTVIFEGIYVGLYLLWLSKNEGATFRTLIARSCIWCGTALIPTALVIIFYAIIGHFTEWWFANVTSIFLKTSPSTSLAYIWRMAHWWVVMFAILVSIFFLRFLFTQQPPQQTRCSIFLSGWACAAFIGFTLFGAFSKHYALPLFAPFFINSAPLWRVTTGRIWICLLLLWGIQRTYAGEKKVYRSGDTTTLHTITSLLSTPQGCVFNYSGPDIILDAVPYCHLTRFPFSAHLSSENEKNALGINPIQEMKNIIAQKPTYIISSEDRANNSGTNISTQTILDSETSKHYIEIYRHKNDDTYDNIIIFRRIINNK